MSNEPINTNFELPEPKEYNLYVESLQKSQSKNNPSINFYKLMVTTDSKTPQTFSVLYFKNQMADLLRSLGAKELSAGVFAPDQDNFRGKWITATIIHEDDKNGIARIKLLNIKPYSVPQSSKREEEIAWDDEAGEKSPI